MAPPLTKVSGGAPPTTPGRARHAIPGGCHSECHGFLSVKARSSNFLGVSTIRRGDCGSGQGSGSFASNPRHARKTKNKTAEVRLPFCFPSGLERFSPKMRPRPQPEPFHDFFCDTSGVLASFLWPGASSSLDGGSKKTQKIGFPKNENESLCLLMSVPTTLTHKEISISIPMPMQKSMLMHYCDMLFACLPVCLFAC